MDAYMLQEGGGTQILEIIYLFPIFNNNNIMQYSKVANNSLFSIIICSDMFNIGIDHKAYLLLNRKSHAKLLIFNNIMMQCFDIGITMRSCIIEKSLNFNIYQ